MKSYHDMTRGELIAELMARDTGDYRDGFVALAADDSEWADEIQRRTMTGCNEHDTTDSRGQPLKPRINDAGEPWWM